MTKESATPSAPATATASGMRAPTAKPRPTRAPLASGARRRLGNAQLVARVGAERVVRHELLRDLRGEFRLEAAST